jgi:hypothetical protein
MGPKEPPKKRNGSAIPRADIRCITTGASIAAARIATPFQGDMNRNIRDTAMKKKGIRKTDSAKLPATASHNGGSGG